MVEGIPGSSPDWHAANVKVKGKAAVAVVPPSHLGTTGDLGWLPCNPADADVQLKTRRHFHDSRLSQTTAWDCLPCVDASIKHATVSSNSPESNSSTSRTAPGSQHFRRHRRLMVPAPSHERPQGKRMVQQPAPPVSCKDLLQDPPDPLPPKPRTAPSIAAATAASTAATSSRPAPAPAASPKRRTVPVWQPQPVTQQAVEAEGVSGQAAVTTGTPTAPVVMAPELLEAATKMATVAVFSGKSGKLTGRVEDDPNYFRTPKDPPTLQRFAASLQPLPAAAGSLSTVQRHEAGIRARQLSLVAAEARDVAALETFSAPGCTGPD